MPATYTYPGVYIEEIPSGVRTITGVSTSNTAFVGYFTRGPMNQAVRITSFADFERRFGGLSSASEAGFAIQQYYANGGSIAFVVRVAAGSPSAAGLMLQGSSPLQDTLQVSAASQGEWGRNIRVAAVATVPASADRFNLVVREVTQNNGRTRTVTEEVHRNLSMSRNDARYVVDLIAQASDLIRITDQSLGELPVLATPNPDGSIPDGAFSALTGGANGNPPDAGALMGSPGAKSGIYALEDIAPEIFNILCIPATANLTSGFDTVVGAATTYCEQKRAFFILDIPTSITSEAAMRGWMGSTGDSLRHTNAAVYFPRLQIADPLNGFRPRAIGASGTMAGLYARIDAQRGVWKAPAGTEADLRGATLAVKLNDLENGGLNQTGVNILRSFPVFGNVCWGARTLEGADQMASEWKYIPVRRTALFIEESLFQALKWVVFEPNDEPLWAQIRLNVGAFMHNLFRQGAFQGTAPREAYLVKCDRETTTQTDINNGIVNIIVGFAPLKPAEFVIIKIQQLAGQVET
jgi:phage tail sheath protein FI